MPVNDKKRAYGNKMTYYISDYKAAFIVGCVSRSPGRRPCLRPPRPPARPPPAAPRTPT